MYCFNSDYTEGCHPAILEKLVATNMEQTTGYGMDAYCDEARELIKKAPNGVILSVKYTRGCDGNAKGIGALIAGMTVEEAIRRLEGITCGKRPTSCPDQLAKVLKSLN